MVGEARNRQLLRRALAGGDKNRETDCAIIKLRGLVNGFGNKVLHDHIDLDVRRGEILGVVGGSGAGKSVLLRSIIGLNQPMDGSVDVFGQRITGDMDSPAMRYLEMRWGVLFQEGALFSSQTVIENIQVPLREYTEMSQSLMDEIAEIKLAMVGLPCDAGDKYPSELSGGMKKRAGLARALALDPELLFLDEPTAGLDPISANQFYELVNGLQQALGLTVFMVTHDIDTLRAVTDRIAVLVNKKLVIGTIDELRKNKDPWIQDYFSGVRGRAALASMETETS
jgi:phospholipid/cholesterol/gamma-HCH transport system ATP-binding protein